MASLLPGSRCTKGECYSGEKLFTERNCHEKRRNHSPASKPGACQAQQGDFVTALRKLLQEEAKAGKSSVDVRAANLHTDVGVYPARGHSMPTCCTVMYEEMQPGDEILLTPPGGKGATLLVRYKFPR